MPRGDASPLAREFTAFSLVPRKVLPFLVVCGERAGGTLFLDLLARHPRIACYPHAYLRPRRVKTDVLPPRRRLTRRPVRGWKVRAGEAVEVLHTRRLADLLRKCEDARVKLFRLDRADIIGQVIAMERARQIEILNRISPRSGQLRELEVNVVGFEADVGELLKVRESVDCAFDGVEHLRMEYEVDLLEPLGQRAGVARAFEFLGLEPVELKTRTPKQVERDPLAEVKNRKEIEAKVVQLGLKRG